VTNAAPVEVEVFVSIGSNVRPQENLRRAHEALSGAYGDLQSSRVYQSQAVGFEGDDFLNMVVGFHTCERPQALLDHIEELHASAKRVRTDNRFSPRTLDVDLLLYGRMVSQRLKIPHPDIDDYAFVARPLAELAPELEHPVSGKTMARLWKEFDRSACPLKCVDIGLN